MITKELIIQHKEEIAKIKARLIEISLESNELDKQLRQKEKMLAIEDFESNLLKQGKFWDILAGEAVAITLDNQDRNLLDFAIRVDPYVYLFSVKELVCLTREEWNNRPEDRR
jgi:hypothetical protein